MNVVASWRHRSRQMKCEYWRCGNCGRFATVRRVACTNCGRAIGASDRAVLPRSFRALENSHSQPIVESMDQVSEHRAMMLVEARNGQLFAFPLCESDSPHAARLVGEALELCLRRVRTNLGPDDPISYGRKLVANAIVRTRLKKNSKTEE